MRLSPNGEFWVEQMYAQYIRLANPRARYPLLMWHGGGLTGATWETTPDGRTGWQMFFLRAGHDVYVSDAMERGRSGWTRFPEIFAGEPIWRTMPYATPDASADAARVKDIPHLVVWGDFLDGDAFWTGGRSKVAAWQERIRAVGGVADTLDLPAEGIRGGNSHMLM